MGFRGCLEEVLLDFVGVRSGGFWYEGYDGRLKWGGCREGLRMTKRRGVLGL